MKKNKPKILSPEKSLWTFPSYIQSALNKCGLDTSSLICSVTGDMNGEGEYCDNFFCFDEKGIYCAIGSVDTPKKRGAQPVCTIDSLVSWKADEIDELYIEKYVSTARLIGKSGDSEFILARFSFVCLGDFDTIVYAFNSMKEKKEIILPDKKGGGIPGENEDEKGHTKGITARLLSFYKKYLPVVALVTFAILVAAAFEIWVPQISTRQLFDKILSNPDNSPAVELMKALALLVLQIFALRLLKVLLDSGHQWLMATVTPRVVYDIKIRIFTAMQRQSVNYYTSKQTGSLMSRVTNDAKNIYWFLINDMPDLIIDIVKIVGIFIIMFGMNVRLSLIILIVLPCLVTLVQSARKMFRSMHHARWVHDSRVSSMVSDNINGSRVIKSFCKEDFETQRFEGESDSLRRSEAHLLKHEYTIFPAFKTVVMLLSVLVFALGSVMVIKGEITVGVLLSFIVYVDMLDSPIDFLSGVVNRWARCMDAATRVFEIIDSNPEIADRPDALPMEECRGEIEINELEFEYEPARPVISKLNLHVEAGEMLGIVGRTGAGKSTIAGLISRLYDPKRGSVKIDGTDTRDLRLEDIHRNVGMVSQDIFLFIGSIADNIRYARPDATMEEVIEAAKAAAAHDFIMQLPDAYETRVGSGGRDLSGGERQRISIARTIIQNPKILILDEATAAMDTQTEGRIQASISALKEGRTTIAIAHRLSTLRDSDHLAVIDDGKVTEYGTYTQLLASKGQFYKLYKIQNEALGAIGIGE